MINTPENRLIESISQQFDCQVQRPLPMGALLHNPKLGETKIITSVRWNPTALDWEYQVTDPNWTLQPIWITCDDLPKVENIDRGFSTSPEQVMLDSLSDRQLNLVADWLHQESLRAAKASTLSIAESIGFIAYRLRVLMTGR